MVLINLKHLLLFSDLKFPSPEWEPLDNRYHDNHANGDREESYI